MTRRLIPATFALIVVAAFGPAGGARAPSISFGSAVIVDPVSAFGEPDIKIAPDGTTYVSGPWGTGTQRSLWEISTDNLRSFRPLHDAAATSSDDSVTTVSGPGGGDTEISIDHNGKVFYADLAALTTLKVATWDPKARSMSTGVFVKGKDNVNGYDRQWFALWDPSDVKAARAASGYTGPLPVNYLTYTEALAQSDCSPTVTCDAASYSTDGINYVDTTSTFAKANDGNIVIDQLTGTVLQAISVKDTNDVGVAIRGRDRSKPSDPALRTVRLVKAVTLEKGTTTGGNVPFPVIAIDQARTAYLVWATRSDDPVAKNGNAWQVFYSFAKASSGWTKWSAPVRLSRPPSVSNTMPWVTGGAKGRIAAVWYGTSDGKDNPSTDDGHQAWDVYLATVARADSGAPLIQQTKVTRHPMHYGTICLAGTGCIAERGNRNLADFFEVTTDPRDGALSIVYTDTSNDLAQMIPGTRTQIPPPVDGVADHRGAPVVTVMRQNGGIGLFGTLVGGAGARATAVRGAKGDARFDPVYGGTDVPQLDLRGVTVADGGNDLVIKVQAASLSNAAAALTATGARAIDYVVRWVGAPVEASTGARNPIYYASVELTDQSSTPSFFAGEAVSYELCSVSGCFPHTIDYPAPPVGGTAITGKLVEGKNGAPDAWELHVPRALVGTPTDTSTLESFSAFTFARNLSATVPLTNLELEAGIAPIEIDGLCCADAKLSLGGTTTVLGTTKKSNSGPLPGTGVASSIGISVALLAAALLLSTWVRRGRVRL